MANNQTKTAKSKKEDNHPKTTENDTRSSSGQTIAITILATVLVCFITTFIVLVCTGVIKFGEGNHGEYNTPGIEERDDHKDDGDDTDEQGTDENGLIYNPYSRVTANGNLVEVDDLEFYLPSKFKSGGKNKDGAYTYNLENDDGWAQVLVFAEKSSLTPTKYLQKISPYLDITDTDYEMNGTDWVQAENANALAYATKLDGKIYAVYYSVKLDSNATSEAMQMIPKTLYMKKIEKD